MRHFRAGSFAVERTGMLRPFCPTMAFHKLEEIPLEGLRERGKKVILIDVDNTMVQWKGEDFSDEVLAWLEKAKSLGFKLCILSNTRRVTRLNRLSGILGVETVRGRFKPSRHMYDLALEKFGITADEAVMVGDQLMTDILGANRAGIEAIWVHRMSDYEFALTRINRFIERLVLKFLYKVHQSPDVDPAVIAEDAELSGQTPDETVVKQFIKFAIVGGSSTAIDLGLHYSLMFLATVNGVALSQIVGDWLMTNLPILFAYAKKPDEAAWFVFKVVTGSVAMLNGFMCNRRWTFGIRGAENRAIQLRKFVAVTLVGFGLNTLITTSLYAVIPGHPKRSWAIANAVAVAAVAFWNFSGQRFWAFRTKTV